MLFLRVMAGVSMLKGLYHWAHVCGIGVEPDELFENHSIAWQTATVFFAVIDLVAAVGLWLAAAWGAVIWLTVGCLDAGGGNIFSAGVRRRRADRFCWKAGCWRFICWLALKSAQEQPP